MGSQGHREQVQHDPRRERGKAIVNAPDQIERLDEGRYLVKSQSGRGIYRVSLNSVKGWDCSCPDHFYREVKCKHIWAVLLSLNIRNAVASRTVIQPFSVNICPSCSSAHIIRHGLRHNKYGDLQRFTCRECGTRFTHNIGFEGMKASPKVITSAMQLYFTGESLRNVQKFLRLQGVSVSHVAVYKWIKKYVQLMEKYLTQIKPQVSDTWRADEMWLKIKGNPKYLYALMDDETRYWIAKEVAGDKFSHEAPEYASRLFRQAKEIAGRKPLTIITDGLHAYHLAYKREFYAHQKPVTKHIEHVTWQGDKGNQKMERFNGEVRDREKVMRGLKREDTPIIPDYQIYHNYVRPHEALNGKTPAETCGIKVEGENKWLTLIQNAAHVPRVNRSKPVPRS